MVDLWRLLNILCPDKKDKTTGKQEILVRFFHGRFNQRGKTNLYGHSDDWDQDRQRFVIPKVRMMTEEKRKEIQELQNLNSELDEIWKKCARVTP